MSPTKYSEAASRLLIQWLTGVPRDHDKRLLIDAALAAERRATVERIRTQFQATTGGYPDLTAKEVEVAAMVFGDLLAILDAEAAR